MHQQKNQQESPKFFSHSISNISIVAVTKVKIRQQKIEWKTWKIQEFFSSKGGNVNFMQQRYGMKFHNNFYGQNYAA